MLLHFGLWIYDFALSEEDEDDRSSEGPRSEIGDELRCLTIALFEVIDEPKAFD